MKTEPSHIVASPTGTMERVFTAEGFDPESRAPSAILRVASGFAASPNYFISSC